MVDNVVATTVVGAAAEVFTAAVPGTHCEYQSLDFVQVEPLTQHVGPDHPEPYTLSDLLHTYRQNWIGLTPH